MGFRHGIALQAGTTDALIGGDRALGEGPLGQGNLVSGNPDIGIYVDGSGTRRNRIVGNLIGTDIHGKKALPNRKNGVVIRGASENVIGGSTPGTWNLISGNTGPGVDIRNGTTTAMDNHVAGNLIGTDLTGQNALGNPVVFTSQEPITPSAEHMGECNIISGNGQAIQIDGTGNKVLGNLIRH